MCVGANVWPLVSDLKASQHATTDVPHSGWAESTLLRVERYGRQRGEQQSAESRRDKFVCSATLTERLFGERDDWSCIQRWKAASPTYGVTDSYVVATATHADMMVMSGHMNPIWSHASTSADTLSDSHVPAVWTSGWNHHWYMLAVWKYLRLLVTSMLTCIMCIFT